MNEALELAKNVLAWWEVHQYDTIPDGDGGEFNVYDTEPEFVTMARSIVEKSKGSTS